MRHSDEASYHHIVPVNQRGPPGIAQDRLDLTRPVPGNRPGLGGGVAHQPLAQSVARGVQNRHRITPPETARHAECIEEIAEYLGVLPKPYGQLTETLYYDVMQQQQSGPLIRTQDLPNPFDTSLQENPSYLSPGGF